MWSQIFIDWVKAELGKGGKTQKGLAAALGVEPAQVSRMLQGTRDIKIDEIPKIIAYIGTNPPRQIIIAEPIIDVKVASLVGALEAGVWREDGRMLPDDARRIPYVPKDEFENLPQFAYRINDDHAQIYAPKDAYLICVDYEAARGSKFVDGDIVILRKSAMSPGGKGMKRIYEWTARQVELRDDKVILRSLCGLPDQDELAFDPKSTSNQILALVIAQLKFV